jgi:predicted kinase
MRKWMRERMKRGKKPSENLSESTGKIGQAIDPMKPAPLMPSYDSSHSSRDSALDSPSREALPESGSGVERPQRPQSPAPQRSSWRGRRPNRQKPRSEPHKEPHRASPDAEQEDSFAGDPETADANDKDSSTGANAAALSKREPRGVVVLTIGLPGSGKTTWFKRREVIPLSSDTLRQLLFDNETEQRYQGLIFSTLRSLLRARLIAKRPMNYVDATNLSPHERRQWIKMARGFGYEVHAVFFDVPLELCLERNRKRHRQVSEDVMRQMATRLRPPTFKEGFSKIVVVRVKKSESE